MERAHSSRGFTLIEMIVALAIFAVLGAVTGRIVSQTVDNFRLVSERGARLVEVQRAMQVMQRDVLQLVDRPIRDPLGDPRDALLIQTDGTLEFSRAGWQNPLQRVRSNLQRVVYRMEGDVLYRAYFLSMDLSPDAEPQVQQLLSGVADLEVLAVDVSGNEYAFWPVAGGEDDPSRALAGIRLRFEMEPYGVIERLWAVPDV
ncbi:MAG: type II secretion system minor pseudopilin GspJ [Pseudomonadales bacterium]